MALSLLVFSMTTFWPVYYVYYDVVLLFASAAVAETLGKRLDAKRLSISLGAVAALVAVSLAVVLPAHLDIVDGSAIAQQALLDGWTPVETDGARPAAWAASERATIALPRRLVSPADIIIDLEPRPEPAPPDRILKVALNGEPLWTGRVLDGAQQIKVPAPKSAWWIGFNRLDLEVASAQAPPPDRKRRKQALPFPFDSKSAETKATDGPRSPTIVLTSVRVVRVQNP